MPHLHAQLTLDPPGAYFGSVALAIFGVSTRTSAADDMDGGVIWLVRNRRFTVAAEYPDMWRPLMREFIEIGVESARIREADTATAMTCAQEDREVPVPRLEIARMRLEHGAGYDEQQGEGCGQSAERGRVCESGQYARAKDDAAAGVQGTSGWGVRGAFCCWRRVRGRPFSTGVVCSFIYS